MNRVLRRDGLRSPPKVAGWHSDRSEIFISTRMIMIHKVREWPLKTRGDEWQESLGISLISSGYGEMKSERWAFALEFKLSKRRRLTIIIQ